MLSFLLIACLPPILPDTGVVLDSGVEVDTSDTAVSIVDADKDGHSPPEDCDDADAAVYPGATERLNWIDDDCDGSYSEFVSDMTGSQVQSGVGFTRSLVAFPGTDADRRVAGSFKGAGEVVVAGAADLADGALSDPLTLRSASGDQFGFDLLIGDLDEDGGEDLLIGDPGSPARYWLVDGITLNGSGTVNVDGLPTVSDQAGAGRVGAAATLLPGTLVVTDINATDSGVFLLDASAVADSLLTDVNSGSRIGSAGATPSFGAALGHLNVNGDTGEDLFVGAPGANGTAGAVYVFSGTVITPGLGNYTTSVADTTLTGAHALDSIGGGFLPAGDLDGDGHPDLYLTTYANRSDARSFYVLLGGKFWTSGELASAAHAVVSGISTYDDGESLPVSYVSATAEDLDGDGANELLIGSTSTTNGHVFLFDGRQFAATGTYAATDAQVDIVGRDSGDGFGQAVALAGAGAPEGLLIVSAPGIDDGSLWTVPLSF